LLARSALPVHSICAAIQSIGVVRRDVECDADYKIGWAILPAILLHGIFDFVLLAYAFFSYIFEDDSTATSKYQTNPPNSNHNDWTTDDEYHHQDDAQQPGGMYQPVDETFAQQMLSFSFGAAITMIGVLYYINEAGKQRGRLQALEMTTAQVPSTIPVAGAGSGSGSGVFA